MEKFSEARDALVLFKKAFKWAEQLDKLFDDALVAQNVVAEMAEKQAVLADAIDALAADVATKRAEADAHIARMGADLASYQKDFEWKLEDWVVKVAEAEKNYNAWAAAIKEAKAAYAMAEAEAQDRVNVLREQADLEEARYMKAKKDIEKLLGKYGG